VDALFFNGGGALGSYLAGYIFDTTSSYQLAFLLCIVFSIIGVILSIFLPAHKKFQAS
jgi:MFS family permease